MAYYGITDFSIIGSSLSGSSSETSLYSLLSDYSQSKALGSAVHTLKSSSLSAKNSTAAESINNRLTTISESISDQVSDIKTQESYTVTSLAKEQASQMYASVTGSGTNVDTTV